MAFDPTILTEWEGLVGGFDSNSKRLFFIFDDTKETGTSQFNYSTSTWTDSVNSYVNIYDGGYHYFIFAWSSSGTALNGATEAQHRLGLIGVDNYIFSPNTNNSSVGKTTTGSFIWHKDGRATNFAIGGFYPNKDSATSKTNFYQATKCFNGYIEEFIMWDRVLDGTVSFSNGVAENPGGSWQAVLNDANPFTNSTLKSISSNIIAYYDFTKDIIGASTAIDRAGSTISGAQISPTTGHTLNLFSSNLLGNTTYLLYDVANNNPTIHFPNGVIQFVNENGITINVGTIFYEFGIIVFDNEYITGSNSGLPLLATLSTSGMGFTSTTSLNVNYISFDNVKLSEKMILNTKAESDEFNVTTNTTGVIKQTGEQFLKDNQGTYITTVGLYNSFDQLLAVAKLNSPIRKDEDHTVSVNVNLDF